MAQGDVATTFLRWRIDKVLTARARRQQFGVAAGMVGFGVLAWGTSLGLASAST